MIGSITHKTVLAVLLLSLVAVTPAYSYDAKSYVAVSAGFAKLDQEVGGGYELIEDGDESYEITLGWDVSDRWGVELTWSDLGSFDYSRSRPTPDFEEVSLISARFNALYYLFSSQGYTGVTERLGFNVFTKFGIGKLDDRSIFSDTLEDTFDDTFFSFGAGAELSLNPFTYFRFQLQGFDDYLALGSVSIMWRWGRSRR